MLPFWFWVLIVLRFRPLFIYFPFHLTTIRAFSIAQLFSLIAIISNVSYSSPWPYLSFCFAHLFSFLFPSFLSSLFICFVFILLIIFSCCKCCKHNVVVVGTSRQFSNFYGNILLLFSWKIFVASYVILLHTFRQIGSPTFKPQ